MKGLSRLIVNYATLGMVDYSVDNLITDSKVVTCRDMENEIEEFKNLFENKSHTKKEIFDILRESGFITEEGILGRIQGEILFNGEYPLCPGFFGHSAWYEFEKSKDKNGKYQVVEKFDIF
ncbi:MAG: hypothetical protein KKF74_05315 [Nanoarchaeota archaeon]|nr:hypothetical protein [Nanoarchaeota archaeon]